MKFIKTLIVTVVVSIGNTATAQNVPGTDLVEKTFELKIVNKEKPSLSLDELVAANDKLNAYIGSYPPTFKDEAEREVIYKAWLRLVSEAEAYAKIHKGSEESLFLLSDYYRQGHNMDVTGSAEKAMEHLDACLAKYKKSTPCHLTASYFYLSIGPKFLDQAEASLAILRDNFKLELNAEVESGYVFLYLYRQDSKAALKQIKVYIDNFPKSPRTEFFKMIQPDLEKTGIKYAE